MRWARAVVKWALHVIRNSYGAVWANPLLAVRSSVELSSLRSHNSNRLGTRLQSGFSKRRWVDCVRVALDHLERNSEDISELFLRGDVCQDGTPTSREALLAAL